MISKQKKSLREAAEIACNTGRLDISKVLTQMSHWNYVPCPRLFHHTKLGELTDNVYDVEDVNGLSVMLSEIARAVQVDGISVCLLPRSLNETDFDDSIVSLSTSKRHKTKFELTSSRQQIITNAKLGIPQFFWGTRKTRKTNAAGHNSAEEMLCGDGFGFAQSLWLPSGSCVVVAFHANSLDDGFKYRFQQMTADLRSLTNAIGATYFDLLECTWT